MRYVGIIESPAGRGLTGNFPHLEGSNQPPSAA